MNSLEISTKTFLEEADWLQDAVYEPLRASLMMLSVDYDLERKASAYAQYGLMLRYAMSLRPEEKEEEIVVVDPIEAILNA